MIDTAHTPIDEWGLTSAGDELGADDVHVWRASLDQPADMIAKLAPLLSQDEYQRAMRYYFTHLKTAVKNVAEILA